MNPLVRNAVRQGFYLDSVALMRMSRTISAMEGVEEAALMMGTPANQEILAGAGLLLDSGKEAGSGDLIIALRAETPEAASEALSGVEDMLRRPARKDTRGDSWRPKTLRAAIQRLPEANLALISIPGQFAVAEARLALHAGLHTMIFSDNVTLPEEAALKAEARDLGLLVMGPDCGTAIIGGTPLAFANVVPQGTVGLIGASGTGTQEVSALIAQYGGGVSHAIGVGGRDLKAAVGGISTLMAIDALGAHEGTEHIVLISKPPAPEVTTRVLDAIATCAKPATICFIGAEEMPMPANAVQVFTLKAAADAAMSRPSAPPPPAPAISLGTGRNLLRGIYAGGTLCAETQAIFRTAGVPVSSNAPIPDVKGLDDNTDGHTVLDLGDDAYTLGRPHPMIDPTVRDEMVLTALRDPRVGVVLVDVVIGYGAHPDPAGHLARMLPELDGRDTPIVITSVTGTDADPQVRQMQVARLENAGVHVAPCNADAAAWALSALPSRS